MKEIEKRLTERGIRPTAVRMLVLRAMLARPCRAFSLADLEQDLDTIDKSTLSRTIHLFHDKLLIHSIDDGTGSIKYSVCRTSCNCGPEELHVHFHCTVCNATYCLESVAIPHVKIPEGYSLDSMNFVLKGRCDTCTRLQARQP